MSVVVDVGPRPATRRRGLGPLLAVLAASAAAMAGFWSPVSDLAFFAFLVPALLLAALATLPSSVRGTPATGLPLALGLVGGWALLVNVMAGQSNGPAARLALVTGLGVVLALATAASRWPATFLIALAGLVVGGLTWGTAGTGEVAAVVTALLAGIALAWLETDHGAWATTIPRLATVPALAALAAGGAGAAIYLQDYEWPEIVLPEPVELPDVPWWLWLLLGLLLLVVLAGLGILARLLYARTRWQAARRQLQAKSPSASVAGAWRWARAGIARYGLPLPAHVAPDLAERGELPGIPVKVSAPLRLLAALAVPAAFGATDLAVDDVDEAWRLADTVVRRSRDRLRGRARFAAAMRGVGPLP
jgi:hypothetical protein